MEDLNNKRLLSMQEAMYYTGLKQVKCREFLESIGAIVRIGTRIFGDREQIDKALNMRNGAAFCQKHSNSVDA